MTFPSFVSARQGRAIVTVAPVESPASEVLPSLVPLSLPSHVQRGSLVALSASLASLQAYDAYSTLSAITLGGTESNPIMQGVVKHPAALILLKGGLAASSIFAATHNASALSTLRARR